MIETLERRVLGAVEFVHAITQARILTPLRVQSDQVKFTLNRSGLYIIREADGFDAYTRSFESPPAPPAGDPPRFELTIEDPEHRFLARRFGFTLPRKNAPASDAQSIFNPIRIDMMPAASSPVAASWALLRARVQIVGDAANTGLANVLVKLSPQVQGLDPQIGFTDAHGEALIAVPGAAPVMPGGGGNGGPVLVTSFGATVSAVVDADVVRPERTLQPFPIPDPDAIERRSNPLQAGVRVVPPQPLTLSAGKSTRTVIEVTWP